MVTGFVLNNKLISSVCFTYSSVLIGARRDRIRTSDLIIKVTMAAGPQVICWHRFSLVNRLTTLIVGDTHPSLCVYCRLLLLAEVSLVFSCRTSTEHLQPAGCCDACWFAVTEKLVVADSVVWFADVQLWSVTSSSSSRTCCQVSRWAVDAAADRPSPLIDQR